MHPTRWLSDKDEQQLEDLQNRKKDQMELLNRVRTEKANWKTDYEIKKQLSSEYYEADISEAIKRINDIISSKGTAFKVTSINDDRIAK